MTAQSNVEPRIVSKDAFRVAGLRYVGKGAPGEIPALWDNEFLPRLGKVADIRISPEEYGISRDTLDFEKTGFFEYLAAVEVRSFDNLPPGMVGWEIPALTYAVLPAHDVPGIGPMLDYFYQQWLPHSQDYVSADGPLFELYGEAFHKDTTIYLYFPVQSK
jgi:AraC family transcriptional regulator